MTPETRREAVELLRRLRMLAGIRVERPRPSILRPSGVGLMAWAQSDIGRALADALVEAGYYRTTSNVERLEAIDRAIATLEAFNG